MSFVPIVNSAKIKDKIAYQYVNSTNLQDYIEVLLSPFDELEGVFADILNKRMLNTSTLDALDTTGILVGLPREASVEPVDYYLGLDAADPDNPVTHGGLGDLNIPTYGGIFRSIEQKVANIVSLTNEEYLPLLQGKIHKNNYKGGTEGLIEAIKDTLGITDIGAIQIEEKFDDPADPFVKIIIYTPLTSIQKDYLQVMNILPKPGGIRFEYSFTIETNQVATSDSLDVISTDNRNVISRRL